MKKDSPLMLGVILFLICAVMTGILAYCNSITAPIIAEAQLKEQQAAMKEVLPEAESFEEINEAVSKGVSGGKTVGYTATVKPDGYGGEITMIVGVSNDMTVTGVKITAMSETAGLGAKAQEESFLEMYKGKKDDVKVVKGSQKLDNEIVAISGATITTNAVTSGVKDALKIVGEIAE